MFFYLHLFLLLRSFCVVGPCFWSRSLSFPLKNFHISCNCCYKVYWQEIPSIFFFLSTFVCCLQRGYCLPWTFHLIWSSRWVDTFELMIYTTSPIFFFKSKLSLWIFFFFTYLHSLKIIQSHICVHMLMTPTLVTKVEPFLWIPELYLQLPIQHFHLDI